MSARREPPALDGQPPPGELPALVEPPAVLTSVLARLKRAHDALHAAAPRAPSDPPPDRPGESQLRLNLGSGRPALSVEERFAWVCQRLALDQLDSAALAACAAPELAAGYGVMLAELGGAPAPPGATPRVVAELLAGPGVSVADVLVCFDRDAQLAATGALRLAGEGPLADRAVIVGGALVNRLLGSRLADETAGGRLSVVQPSPLPLGREQALARLEAIAAAEPDLPIVLVGPDALLAIAAVARRGVVALDARALADESACADLALAAALEDRVAAIHRLGELTPEEAAAAVRRATALACRPVLCARDEREAVCLAELTAHVVSLAHPDAREREAAWRAATGREDLGELAARFRLDISAISQAARLAGAQDGARPADADGRVAPASAQESAGQLAAHAREPLWEAARAASTGRLWELAVRLAPGPGWEDLILPARQIGALHALSSFLANRERVLSEWGYRRIARERGLTALFAGESGTGKTLAAQVIAARAGLDVYRVDLSSLFSKWVGETEKNLERLFAAAQSANAILFFDEADVVFGKRTESRDSSDRYANLETAFLLQRIESYDGVVVLASNLRANMDEAFVRRLDLVVDFPPPDAATRRRLWEALLPTGAPRGDDIDLGFLAERFELSGGGIRNCSLAAALLAAEEGESIHMRHLIRAVAIEFAKLGRLTVEADFGSFHGSLANGGSAPAGKGC